MAIRCADRIGTLSALRNLGFLVNFKFDVREKDMSMSANDVLKMVKDREVKFVDFRFTDTRGKEQHVGVPVKVMGMEKFEEGHAFDGSSIAGWKGIQASDML